MKKWAHLSRFIQPGVLSRQEDRNISSALSNSDLQFVHAFRGRHASTSCLSSNSAHLRLQFQLFRDAEAELGNESSSETSIIVDGKNTKFDNDTQYLQNNLVSLGNFKQTAQYIVYIDNLRTNS